MREVIHRMMFRILAESSSWGVALFRFYSSLFFLFVTPCVLVPCWLAWNEPVCKKKWASNPWHLIRVNICMCLCFRFRFSEFSSKLRIESFPESRLGRMWLNSPLSHLSGIQPENMTSGQRLATPVHVNCRIATGFNVAISILFAWLSTSVRAAKSCEDSWGFAHA